MKAACSPIVLDQELDHLRALVFDVPGVVHLEARREAVRLARRVVEEQRPDEAVELPRRLPHLHLALVVAEAPHEIDRAAVERDVVALVDGARLRELLLERRLELLRLLARPGQFGAGHQQREEQRVLHHDVVPEQVVGHRVAGGRGLLRDEGGLRAGIGDRREQRVGAAWRGREKTGARHRRIGGRGDAPDKDGASRGQEGPAIHAGGQCEFALVSIELLGHGHLLSCSSRAWGCSSRAWGRPGWTAAFPGVRADSSFVAKRGLLRS
jgi:hypothetical protein